MKSSANGGVLNKTLEKSKVTQLFKKFSAFYEADGLLQCSQEPTTCPYRELYESSPHIYTLLLEESVYIRLTKYLLSCNLFT
jgi:hypothetical protein